MNAEISPSLIKVSIAFEPRDYEWALERSTDLYGRRGMGMYIRRLIRDDKDAIAEKWRLIKMEQQEANR